MRFHEIFDTKHDDVEVTWSTTPQGEDGQFEFEGIRYGIQLARHTIPISKNQVDGCTIDFYHVNSRGKPSYKSTNAGNPAAILNIVSNSAIAKLKSMGGLPDIILIRISKKRSLDTKKQIKKRKLIYAGMMKRLTVDLGYKPAMPWIDGTNMVSRLYSIRQLNPMELIMASNELRGK